ncbi:MAG: YceI family protein [Deltaproteobacteria bacterium]|nr:YceI family protein [Deltaproteobacteria bacterium]
MKPFCFLSVLLLGALLFSGESESKECRYQIRDESIKITWTGYKFNEKAPVSGTFRKTHLEQNKMSGSIPDLFRSVRFRLDTISLDSGLSERDKKLILFLFGSAVSPAGITGQIRDFDMKQKTANVSITMNGRSADVRFAVTEQSDRYTFRSEIDLLRQFAMDAQLSALHEACKQLHTGADGVSRTWPLVGLEVQAELLKSGC